MGIFYFIIMIGALVFFHELGHFLVAKAFNVKVLRFSIGFGPKIAGFRRGETEYVICALPLGGYVQMLGSDFTDVESVPEEDRERSLMAKPIWQRSLVVLAGPVFNLILPLFVFFFFGLTQTTAQPAIVGEVLSDTPAAEAGLESGDRITAIAGEEVRYWHDLLNHTVDSPNEKLEFTWERHGEPMSATIVPTKRVESEDALGVLQKTRGQIGILLSTHGPTIAIGTPDAPAAKAGLQNFDKLVTIDGERVERLDRILDIVEQSDGQPLGVVALRPDKLDRLDYGDMYEQKVVEATIQPVKAEDNTWTAGFVRAEMVLSEVEDGSPADKAGLKVGDHILSLDGKAQNSWMMLTRTIHFKINDLLIDRDPESDEPIEVPFELTYARDGEVQTTTIVPDVTKYTDHYQQERYKREIGWKTVYDTVDPDPIPMPLGDRLGYAVELGADKTWDGLSMIGKLFQRIFEGRISFTDQVGGPILVGELAARAGEAGAKSFLWTMALLSINLGVFNLLPIPLLDGGQLALFGVEAIKRGPLSFRVRQITAYIGFVMIIMLMVLAFKNDIERNWDTIVNALF